jgi:futalosine hydrolase
VSSVLICVSTAVEREGLPQSIGGTTLTVLQTGVGPVNAAFALTRCLMTSRPRAIIACGVGGAYAGSGLTIGDVVSAASETYADLGAASPDGFLDMEALGFPVVDGTPPLFNRLPLDLFPTVRRVPFVTSSTCTGTDDDAQAIALRTGGAVESMEGAAIVHVARLSGVPVGELRGISNPVGNRDRSAWRLDEAARQAQEALLRWLNG